MHSVGCAVVATVRVCRTIPSADPPIVADDGSADDTGYAARVAGATAVRHFIEHERASTIETGVKVAAMRNHPDGPPRHISLLSSDLSGSVVGATTSAETVLARQTDMVIAIPAAGREHSGYRPGVARHLIRRKTGWNRHCPLSYQRYLMRETINAAMSLSDCYMLGAFMTVNALHAGLSIIEAPCNFAYSGMDRSPGSLNRLARMFGAIRTTIN